MIELSGLPINDFNIIKRIKNGEAFLDMHNITFDGDKIHQTFIFLRNMNIQRHLIFDKCSFGEKSEFLIRYLTGNIDLEVDELTTTWVDIVMRFHGLNFDETGILERDDISKFIDNNFDLVKILTNIIVSIPLCFIKVYSDNTDVDVDITEVQYSDYNEINNFILVDILSDDRIVYVITSRPGEAPTFYNKYFNNHLIHKISNLPYMNLLNMIFSPDSIKDSFFKSITTQ